MKWTTIVEYVDVETGEYITKSEVERNYYKVKKLENVRTEIREDNGYKWITWECRRNGQRKLWG